VLVIDELAELSRLKLNRYLASILAIGRSKAINVIAATQHPLANVVGGSTAKANFTERLVGRMLCADDAKVAAGMSGSGAEYLPGRGSFLRINGAEARRFQAYWADDFDARAERIAGPMQLPLPGVR
jgi:DNA segregation ATPase FtsK/SpoIIIE-like protein